MELAEILWNYRTEIQSVVQAPNIRVDPQGEETNELAALCHWLFKEPSSTPLAVLREMLGLEEPSSPHTVLQQMLRLDVVLVATAGTAQIEQAVELVQVSCSDPAAITGIQMHHFGAFYRAPWRVNDWIEGRLDGAKQVMRFLLSPDRLRQLGYTTSELRDLLRRIATPNDSGDAGFLSARWDRNVATYEVEIERVSDPDAPAVALDGVADALAMPLRLQALREDFPALAKAIRGELKDTVESSKVWLADYEAKLKAAPAPAPGTLETSTLSADDLWQLRDGMKRIGQQRIAADLGSDTFARAVSQTATVTAGAIGNPPKIGKVKAVQLTFSAIRGYTAMVWILISYLTRGSVFGTRVVELAVAVGGALLAVALLVPDVPLALTLTGVLLLLSATTAAALRTKGARWFAARIGIAALLVGAVLAYLIWRDVAVNGWAESNVLPTLIKGGVGVAIVLLGSYVAKARPSKREAWGVACLIVVVLVLLAALIWWPPPGIRS